MILSLGEISTRSVIQTWSRHTREISSDGKTQNYLWRCASSSAKSAIGKIRMPDWNSTSDFVTGNCAYVLAICVEIKNKKHIHTHLRNHCNILWGHFLFFKFSFNARIAFKIWRVFLVDTRRFHVYSRKF